MEMPIWRKLFMHWILRAKSRERFNDGIKSAAKMEMITMTTSSSIKVNAMIEL